MEKEFRARDLPEDIEEGFPVERGIMGEDRVFRSGGSWYYQFRGYPYAWGPYPTAAAAEKAANEITG